MKPLSQALWLSCWIALVLFPFCERADAQLLQKSISYENGTRVWFEHVPASYNGSKAVPLVIALHGAFSSGDQFASSSGWLDVSDSHGFVVVFPDGQGSNNNLFWHSWTFDGSKPDDIGFLLQVIGQVEATYHIDATRVYMTGFSNGGGMTSFFAAYHADLLAATAPMSAGWVTNTGNSDSILKPDARLPVWLWRGANDGTADTPPVFVQDQQQTAFWVAVDGDGTTPKTSTVNNDTTSVYTGGAEVRHTTVAGLAHAVEAGSAERSWTEFFSRFSRVNGAIQSGSARKVKLGVAKPKARSRRGTNGVFLVSLDAPTTSDLTVSYGVTGSAVGGVDYKTLTGSATVPSGASFKKVKVRPLAATDGETGKKTVRLTLLPGSDYTLDDPAAGKVKIVEGD